eukprot:NODE_937_length_2933_cov_0.413550.p3 type:complete len:197 gc:universal NODE_937_length_2933_cov_0.413550:2158-2748(+)
MMNYSVELITKLRRSPLVPIMPEAIASVNAKTRKKQNSKIRSNSPPEAKGFAINGEVFFDSSAVYDHHANSPLNGGGANWWEQVECQPSSQHQQYLGLQHFGGNLVKNSGFSGSSRVPQKHILEQHDENNPSGFEVKSDQSKLLHSMMRRRSQTLQALGDVNGDLSKLQLKMSTLSEADCGDAYDLLVQESRLLSK